MPYKSRAQQAFFHTDTARKQGITPAVVEEFDKASKGLKLPKRAGRKKNVSGNTTSPSTKHDH